MKKANGGKDLALLAKLAEEIRAAYPQGATSSRVTAEPANRRIEVMEYINTIVPEPDRKGLRVELEKIPDDQLDNALAELRGRYEL